MTSQSSNQNIISLISSGKQIHYCQDSDSELMLNELDGDV